MYHLVPLIILAYLSQVRANIWSKCVIAEDRLWRPT